MRRATTLSPCGRGRSNVAGSADQMGAVMRRIMPRIEGRFDGRDANRIVREELAP
ncbi:MAG: GatB/YqeY domain-containing protein [Gemmatimonadota bacterium]|nr:GatB/YqeY domain-containing protein [Gemmatimonadota bacterium]